jgi:hypothetical protein
MVTRTFEELLANYPSGDVPPLVGIQRRLK